MLSFWVWSFWTCARKKWIGTLFWKSIFRFCVFGIDGLCGWVWESRFYKNCSNLSIDMPNISFVKAIWAVIGSLLSVKLIFRKFQLNLGSLSRAKLFFFGNFYWFWSLSLAKLIFFRKFQLIFRSLSLAKLIFFGNFNWFVSR